jgi:hypothetical protein
MVPSGLPALATTTDRHMPINKREEKQKQQQQKEEARPHLMLWRNRCIVGSIADSARVSAKR